MFGIDFIAIAFALVMGFALLAFGGVMATKPITALIAIVCFVLMRKVYNRKPVHEGASRNLTPEQEKENEEKEKQSLLFVVFIFSVGFSMFMWFALQ